MKTLTALEAYAQFLIAQALMAHDYSLLYEEAWSIASTLLNDFLESEEFWHREPQSNPHNLSYRLAENWVNNTPIEKLQQS